MICFNSYFRFLKGHSPICSYSQVFKKTRLLLPFLMLMGFFSVAQATSKDAVVGVWHGMSSDLKISIIDEQLHGSIVKQYPDKKGEILTHCDKGACQGQPLIGLELFRNFKWNSKKSRWQGQMLASGWNGKWYNTDIYINKKGQLKTTFRLGIFSYSITWKKTKSYQ